MTYPRLEEADLVQTVAGEDEILGLTATRREEISILMTSATVGCSARLVQALPSLRFVVSQGAGRDRFDLAALDARGVRLRNVGEALTEDVADLAMALVQMSSRHLVEADRFARSGGWSSGRFQTGFSLVGATMGIAGLSGRIGQAIARRARASCMSIAGLDRSSNEGLADTRHTDLKALAKASDVLVLAMPGLPSLRHAIGTAELNALGPQGRLVNVGRGDLVDTQALVKALASGAIFAAGLDVLEGEPAVPGALAALSNVVLSPHIGGATWGARARGARIAEDEILAELGRS